MTVGIDPARRVVVMQADEVEAEHRQPPRVPLDLRIRREEGVGHHVDAPEAGRRAVLEDEPFSRRPQESVRSRLMVERARDRRGIASTGGRWAASAPPTGPYSSSSVGLRSVPLRQRDGDA